jgi:hypothetical protein
MAVATWLQAFKLAGRQWRNIRLRTRKAVSPAGVLLRPLPTTKTLLTQLKKAITEATRTHGYVECRAMRGWVLGIESVLDRTAGLIT